MQKDLVTVEYYAGPDELVGAVYVPKKSAADSAQIVGRSLNVALGRNELTAHILDCDGNLMNEMIIFRRR